MANHKSALKRIKSDAVKKDRNRYQHKTTRTWIKRVRESNNKEEAQKIFVEAVSMIDKLAKKNIIHKNKASNLKSSLSKHVQSLN